MPSNPVWTTEGAPAATSTPVDVVERASPDLTTTLTADPGAAGTTLAVTANTRFPATNGYRVRVEKEVMLITAGAGTNSWTVTRGQDNTTAVAHAIGVTVSMVVGVQRVESVSASKQVSFIGRGAGFRAPGRAGVAGQKVVAIHNATGSAVTVDVTSVWLDFITTVAIGKIGSIIPPIIRLWRFTALPTNGTALAKLAEDTTLVSNASVTLWQDASADGTSSTTALTITLPAANYVSQVTAPNRVFGTTGTGTNPWMEASTRVAFLSEIDSVITLQALQGVCLFLDYTVGTANPVTDFWLPTVRWVEYTAA